MLAVIVVGWTRWLLGPYSTPSPVGPDKIETWRMAVVRLVEAASTTVALVLVWKFLARPILRDRRISFDGMLLMACWFLWFWDPVDNYFNFSFSYNAHFVNLASWTRYIPGWEAPNQQLFPEPLFLNGGLYVWFTFGAALIGCAVLRKAKARYPQLSTFGLFTVLVAVFAVLDLVVEGAFIWTGMFAYPGAPHSLTLWAGTPHQFPLYEPFMVASFGTGMTAIRHFRDDRGRSFVQRGIDTARLPERAKTFVSFLSITGFVHFFVFVGYFLPYNWMAMKADTFPAMPSYHRAGICGAGTDYACPSQYVPVPSRDSLHITPDDPRLPAKARS